MDKWMYGVWMDGNEGWFDGLMDGCLVSAQLALTFPTFITFDLSKILSVAIQQHARHKWAMLY